MTYFVDWQNWQNLIKFNLILTNFGKLLAGSFSRSQNSTFPDRSRTPFSRSQNSTFHLKSLNQIKVQAKVLVTGFMPSEKGPSEVWSLDGTAYAALWRQSVKREPTAANSAARCSTMRTWSKVNTWFVQSCWSDLRIWLHLRPANQQISYQYGSIDFYIIFKILKICLGFGGTTNLK